MQSFFRKYGAILIPSIGIVVVIGLLGYGFYVRGQAIMHDQIRSVLRTSATIAAMNVRGEDIENIHGIQDIDKPEFIAIADYLDSVRDSIPNARFAYIFRRTDMPNILEFVVDADIFADPSELDYDGNGQVDSYEEQAYPGEQYDISEIPILQGEAFERPAVDPEIYIDQWGALVSGFAPIYTEDGRVVGTLGIDILAEDFIALGRKAFSPVQLTVLFFFGLGIGGYVMYTVWRKRLEYLRILEQERSSLLTLATHQLGSPLASIRWWLEILEEHIRSKKAAEALKNLHAAIERITGVITELRKVEQIEKDNASHIQKKVSLKTVLNDVLKQVKPNIRHKKQRIALAKVPSVKVLADKNILVGVFAELLYNASSFSPDKSNIAIAVQRQGTSVVVSIQDKGCGVPKKELERIFGKMTRGSNAGVCKPDGNGLGLYVARTILTSLGGRIWCDSTVGEGSTFFVELPISK